MKKIFIFSLISSLIFLSSCSVVEKIQKPKETKKIETNNSLLSKEDILKIKEEQVKKRKQFYSLIRKWDFYSLKNKKEDALKQYLEVYDKLGADYLLEQKIADVYFELNDYANAYDFYKKSVSLGSLETKEQENLLKSLFYSGKNIETELKDLANFSMLSKDVLAYYKAISTCNKSMPTCLEELKKISKDPKAKNILDIINIFNNSWSKDPLYKNALIAWRFLQNWDYTVAIKIWEEILKQRPDYKAILEIVWSWYYKIWKYKEAWDILAKYYSLDTKNTKVAYMLWMINFYQWNYTTSTLFFNNAILNWYKPKTELERKLIYNYFLIWDNKWMLNVFRYLLTEPDVQEDDYKIWIFIALEENDKLKAATWAKKWLDKFSESESINAFNIEINRLFWKIDEAEKYLSKAFSLNKDNHLVYFYAWNLAYDKNDFENAKNYYNKAIELDKEWLFAEKAQNMITQTIQKEVNLSTSWATVSQ